MTAIRKSVEMAESSETKVFIPEENIAESCEIVNRWLDRNENFVGGPPAEHYIMSEITDHKFRRSLQRNQAAPLYLPITSVNFADMTISPMAPAYSEPLRKSYAEMTTVPPGLIGTYPPHTHVQNPKPSQSEIQMTTQTPMQYTQTYYEPGTCHIQNPTPSHSEIQMTTQMPMQYTQTYYGPGTCHIQNPTPSRSQIQMTTQMPMQHTQTYYEPVTETQTSAKASKDAIVYFI